MKTLYLVQAMEKSHEITSLAFYENIRIDFCWAKGMIGVLPVFDNREDAEKYSKGKFEITELTVGENYE